MGNYDQFIPKNSEIPKSESLLSKLPNIIQDAALNSAKNIMSPGNPLSFGQMNDIATNPGLMGDVGAGAGYYFGHPTIGGAAGQAGGEALKESENFWKSGGTQDPYSLKDIGTQAAIGGGKGVLAKFGVGAVTNLVPGMRNFASNKLIEAAKSNRGAITNDYSLALDKLENTANKSGRTADMGTYLRDLATTPKPPTSQAQEIAQNVIDEAGKRGIDLSKLSPKDSKEVQDIFDSESAIWHANPANTGVSRAQSGVNDMDRQLSSIRDNAFSEFEGMNKSFQKGIKPFQSKAMTRAGITNSKGNVTGDAYSVAGLMDKSPTGARGEVLNANAPGVFGSFGNQVLKDASGFHRGVQTIGNILQRIAQMAGGVGAGYGIGKGIGGGTPPTP